MEMFPLSFLALITRTQQGNVFSPSYLSEKVQRQHNMKLSDAKLHSLRLPCKYLLIWEWRSEAEMCASMQGDTPSKSILNSGCIKCHKEL